MSTLPCADAEKQHAATEPPVQPQDVCGERGTAGWDQGSGATWARDTGNKDHTYLEWEGRQSRPCFRPKDPLLRKRSSCLLGQCLVPVPGLEMILSAPYGEHEGKSQSFLMRPQWAARGRAVSPQPLVSTRQTHSRPHTQPPSSVSAPCACATFREEE